MTEEHPKQITLDILNAARPDNVQRLAARKNQII
jgi:hypothetical protein